MKTSRLPAFLASILVFIVTGCPASDQHQNDGDVDLEADGDTESPRLSLSCPVPGPLPFITESNAFIHQASSALAAGSTFFLDENHDIVGTVEAAQEIRGAFIRGTNGLFGTPFIGEWVSVWKTSAEGKWRQLGRAQTDDTGAYVITIPATDRFGPGTGRVYAILEGDGSCAVHAVVLWPAGAQALVTDIDGTMTFSDQELLTQLGSPGYDPVENTGAHELMNAWSGKGYFIIYLTARPHTYREITRAWLEGHGFPFGPLITAESMLGSEATQAYKAGWLIQAIDQWEWNLVAAYGNADTDIGAYADAGIPTTVTFIIGPEAGVGGTVAISDNDYTSHIDSYVAAQPAATQPF